MPNGVSRRGRAAAEWAVYTNNWKSAQAQDMRGSARERADAASWAMFMEQDAWATSGRRGRHRPQAVIAFVRIGDEEHGFLRQNDILRQNDFLW